MEPRVEIRPAADADAEFAFLVEEDAMRRYAEETWGQWNPAQDRQAHIDSFDAAAHSVIEVDGCAAGVLAVERHRDHIFLAKLYLFSVYRGAGTGGRLLETLIEEASARDKPIRLTVLAVNRRALAFYARHGFDIELRTAERVQMTYTPIQRSNGAI